MGFNSFAAFSIVRRRDSATPLLVTHELKGFVRCEFATGEAIFVSSTELILVRQPQYIVLEKKRSP